jgi:hypothetical protein
MLSRHSKQLKRPESMRSCKTLLFGILPVGVLLCISSQLHAEEGAGGQYIPGAYASLLNITPNKPGFAVGDGFYFYTGGAGGGKTLPFGGLLAANLNANVYFDAISLVDAFRPTILGAHYTVALAIPYVWATVSINPRLFARVIGTRTKTGAEEGSTLDENRPFLIILQSENDQATGQFFPIGTGLFNIVNFRAHWDKVPVPGSNGQKVSESEFYDQTPGNNKYLVNYHVVPLGETSPPSGLRANENRAFEANIKENHPDYSFYTSEHNDHHEDRFCHNGSYNPDEFRPSTGREIWRRWQFVYTGNARVPCWIARVPKEIIWGHGGLWSDNSVAMLAALFRIHFPLTAGGMVAPPQPRLAPRAPDVQQLNQDKPR